MICSTLQLSRFQPSFPLLVKQQDSPCSLSFTRIICYRSACSWVFIFLSPLLQRPPALSNCSWKKFFPSLLLPPPVTDTTSSVSMWDVFIEHRAPTERRRMNSACDTKWDNLTLDFFLINLLSQSNCAIIGHWKTVQIINYKTVQRLNYTFVSVYRFCS